MIELRSDTFTLPTLAMRRAIAGAVVGDDGYGEDPTVARLEEMAAARVGKAAACLMPSGTMANLAAMLAHCPRGTGVVVGADSDIYRYEGGGGSICGGLIYLPVPNQADGRLDLQDLATTAPEDPHDPQFVAPALYCLENTQNRCGGAVLAPAYLSAVQAAARARGVAVHLDGARLFNAAVALGVPAAEIGGYADSVQFCLSKGLAAPIGSVVAGDRRYIDRVRRVRKMLGGGMRQAGIVAAAGIVALEEMVDRLAEDHATAARLARGIAGIPGLRLDQPRVQTNIVIFRLTVDRLTTAAFLAAAHDRGLALAELGPGRIRAVTHHGITDQDIDRALHVVAGIMSGRISRSVDAA